jgi:hypothetical protein
MPACRASSSPARWQPQCVRAGSGRVGAAREMTCSHARHIARRRLAIADSVVYKKGQRLGAIRTRCTVDPAARHCVMSGMPIVSADGDISHGSGRSSVSMSPTSALCTSQYAFGRLMPALIQDAAASFFCETPDLSVVEMLSAKIADRGASCAQASGNRERGL